MLIYQRVVGGYRLCVGVVDDVDDDDDDDNSNSWTATPFYSFLY